MDVCVWMWVGGVGALMLRTIPKERETDRWTDRWIDRREKQIMKYMAMDGGESMRSH